MGGSFSTHKSLFYSGISGAGCLTWFLYNFLKSEHPKRVYFDKGYPLYGLILTAVCGLATVSISQLYQYGFRGEWSAGWKKVYFDGMAWIFPTTIGITGLLSSNSLTGPKLFSQAAFGLANVFYYQYYDKSISDCLSQTYRDDKYGVSVSYLIAQLMLQALSERSLLLNSTANLDSNGLRHHLLSSYLFLTLRLLKAFLLNSVFQHHTSARGADRTKEHSNAHMGFVISCGIVEFLFVLISLTLHPTTESVWKALQKWLADPSTPLLWLWLISFKLAQQHVDKSRDLSSLPRLPTHNLSWLTELCLLTTTIK